MLDKKRKSGYVFVLDVTIAAIILLIGITLLFYTFSQKERNYYLTDQLSNDIIGVLAETDITDLCVNPGPSAFCSCPNYDKLSVLVCNDYLRSEEGSLLSLFSELIETGAVEGVAVEDTIYEIFVTKKVIDEKRFGFAVIYTTKSTTEPLELYNTLKYEREH